MKRAIVFLIALLVIAGQGAAQERLMKVRSWICFYGSSFPSNIRDYDLYVLARTGHPDISPLKQKGSIVVGYVSAGEINMHDESFAKVPKDILLEENKDWEGAHRVDIRSVKWHSVVLNELVPSALKEGFDGIFIDTIDTALYLENEKGLKGSVESAVSLIRKIRQRHPGIVILLNNGLFLVDKVGDAIDALVVEDVYTLYDFKTKRYSMASDEWTKERLGPIDSFRERFAKPVLSLDYLSGRNKRAVSLVAKRARSDGLVPYISDIGLKTVYFHP